MANTVITFSDGRETLFREQWILRASETVPPSRHKVMPRQINALSPNESPKIPKDVSHLSGRCLPSKLTLNRAYETPGHWAMKSADNGYVHKRRGETSILTES